MVELEQTENRLTECERKEGILKSKLMFTQHRCALLNDKIKIYEKDNALLMFHLKTNFNDSFEKIYEKMSENNEDNLYLNTEIEKLNNSETYESSSLYKRQRKTWSNIWCPISIAAFNCSDDDEKKEVDCENLYQKISDIEVKELYSKKKNENKKAFLSQSDLCESENISNNFQEIPDLVSSEQQKYKRYKKQENKNIEQNCLNNSLNPKHLFNDIRYIEDEYNNHMCQEKDRFLHMNKRFCKNIDLMPVLNEKKWFVPY
ncbi:MATH and LRR domain-containing protein PFE0570w isoform X2 [Hydra vulgaris]|uniref:MATH and LRR domain-containing protein PFE0570w isoform X2 n=1 Tax=Hydra vulgaris TaxID=6087 RepID=UPI0032EA26BF